MELQIFGGFYIPRKRKYSDHLKVHHLLERLTISLIEVEIIEI